MPSDKPKVALTCTTTGSVDVDTIEAINRVAADPRFEIKVSLTHFRPYSNAMNSIFATLMVQEEFDWWLHTDSDQNWQPDVNPLDATAHGLPIVGFPTPIYKPAAHAETGEVVIGLNAWMRGAKEEQYFICRECQGLQRVDMIGSGSFLMHLPYFRTFKDRLPDPFSETFSPHGTLVLGPDVSFCRKLRAMQIPIHADYSIQCEHRQKIPLLDLMISLERMNKPEAPPTDKHLEPPSDLAPVIVVGTGRCGSSTVARILHDRCGVWMGGEFRLPDANNPHGYYEAGEMVIVNQSRLDGRIDEARWRDRVGIVARGIAEGRELWGWKDPRTAEFMPDIVRMFPKARFIWCRRPLGEAVDSCMRCYGMRHADATALVDRRNHRIVQNIRAPFLEIDLSALADLGEDWAEDQIREFLDLPNREAVQCQS